MNCFVLTSSVCLGIDDVCVEFDKGTALHIAAAGLGREVIECLVC